MAEPSCGTQLRGIPLTFPLPMREESLRFPPHLASPKRRGIFMICGSPLSRWERDGVREIQQIRGHTCLIQSYPQKNRCDPVYAFTQ